MKTRDRYTTFDTIKILDMKMERLQDWLKRGFIKPTYEEEVGRGIKKYFDRNMLYAIKTFMYLVENGITRQEAANWIKDIHESLKMDEESLEADTTGDPKLVKHLKKKPTFIIVSKGDSIHGEGDTMTVTNEDEIKIDSRHLSKPDAIHIINFKKIIDAVEQRLED